MDFQNNGRRMTCLDECLKSNISEHRSIVNMVNGPKNCCNMYDSTLSNFRLVLGKWSWKKSLFVKSEILRLVANTLSG